MEEKEKDDNGVARPRMTASRLSVHSSLDGAAPVAAAGSRGDRVQATFAGQLAEDLETSNQLTNGHKKLE